ncbi:MAG: M48 family metallopeptidase [Archangium sp.]
MKRAAFAALLSLCCSCATTESAEKKDGEEEERSEKSKKPTGLFGGINMNMAEVQAQAARMSTLAMAARAKADATCSKFQLREVPWSEEQRVGTFLAVRELKAHPVFSGDKIVQHVALVGKLLARRSQRPDLPWTFGVVTNDVPDAQGLAGGYVFVTTGLLAQVKNEAELAAVLSHEIAHVAARHPVVVYSQALANQCSASVMIADLARNGVSPGPSQQQMIQYAERFGNADVDMLLDADRGFEAFLFDTTMSITSWNSEREYEADATGTELMAFAGYDLTGFDTLVARLETLPMTNKDGRTFRAGWLGNKPSTDSRLAKLKALREGELAAFSHSAAKPDLTELLAPLKK